MPSFFSERELAMSMLFPSIPARTALHQPSLSLSLSLSPPTGTRAFDAASSSVPAECIVGACIKDFAAEEDREMNHTNHEGVEKVMHYTHSPSPPNITLFLSEMT